MILELKNDPTKQAHQTGFMITDDDVDTIVMEWPDEWCSPLVEPLPKEQNQEDPSTNQGGNASAGGDARISQGNGQGNNGGNGQDNQSQEEKDDNNGNNGSHRSDEEQTSTDEETRNSQKQKQQQRGPLHKKRKFYRAVNMNTLTEDDVQELIGAVAEVVKKSLKALNTQ